MKKQPKASEPSGARGRRPPDYVIVVSASDWLKDRFPKPRPSCPRPCRPARSATANPSPTWKPNHDRDPEVTAMTLTINDTTMTSDQTAHTARHAPGRQHGWEVSWLPGQVLDRNTAITAMMLADTVNQGDLDDEHRLWAAVQSWAAELGLTEPDAIALAIQPPSDLNRQHERANAEPDREAAD